MTDYYKWYPFFYYPTLEWVPKILSNALKADEVQIQNLPNYPPGASYDKFNLLTLQVSTPGMFLKAFTKLLFSLEKITNGPFLNLYLLFLYLPYPALIVFES